MKNIGITLAVGVAALVLDGCAERSREFDACGQIEATEVIVSAESNGRIVALSFAEGDRLEKGEVVGVIDSMQVFLQKNELIKRKANAQSKLVDINRQLASQYAQLKTLQKDYDRYRALEAKDAGTKKQVDDAASQIAVLEREIAAKKQTYERNNAGIEAEMAMYDVQIAQKKDLLDKCRITAPMDGLVLTKFAEEGEMATAGKSVLKMADMDNVYVRAYVTTLQLSDVKIGDAVDVAVEDGTADARHYEGRVTWISDEAEFTPKNIQTKDERADLVYAVKVSVPNDGYLKIGMYAYIRFRQ